MSYEIVAIGTSLGGFEALKIILGGLHFPCSVSIVIVQHRMTYPEDDLGSLLQQHCPLPVSEVHDKDAILAGHVYLAPPGYHLLAEEGWFSLSTESPVSYSRPSIDVLFESVADVYGERACGVILTGANEDGAQGARMIRDRGGLVIVQDPETAEHSRMPREALAATSAQYVLPLAGIVGLLNDICHVN